MPFGLGRTTVGVGIGVLLVLLLAGGYGVSQTVGGDDDPEPTATAEPEESAVLCEPEDSEDGDDGASVETPAVPADSSFGGRELFFQNDARWGNIEYDHATSLAGGTDWCGNTIAGCGCAMTSVANILSLFGVLATPDGQELNPQAFDNWLGTPRRSSSAMDSSARATTTATSSGPTSKRSRRRCAAMTRASRSCAIGAGGTARKPSSSTRSARAGSSCSS